MSISHSENFRNIPQQNSGGETNASPTELTQAQHSVPSTENRPLSFLAEKGLLSNTEKGVHFNIVALTKMAYDLNTNEARNTFTLNTVRDLVSAYRSKILSKTAFNAFISHLKRVQAIGPNAVTRALAEIDKENENLPSIFSSLPVANENRLTKQPSYLPVTIPSPRQAQRLLRTVNYQIGLDSPNRQGEVTEAIEMLTEFLSTATSAPNLEEIYEELCKKFNKGIPKRFYEVLATEAEYNGTILELLRYICKEQGLRMVNLEIEPTELDDQADDHNDDLYIVTDYNDLDADGVPRKKKVRRFGDGDALSDLHRQNERNSWEY